MSFLFKKQFCQIFVTCPITHAMTIFHMAKHDFYTIGCYTFYIRQWIQGILQFPCMESGDIGSIFSWVLKSVLKPTKFYANVVALRSWLKVVLLQNSMFLKQDSVMCHWTFNITQGNRKKVFLLGCQIKAEGAWQNKLYFTDGEHWEFIRNI